MKMRLTEKNKFVNKIKEQNIPIVKFTGIEK